MFGDYVSIYNFAQSVADGATVPLYYEARKPELQLSDAETLGDELDELLDAAMLDDEQEQKLQREFARQYHLITRDDRLEQIAADLARHFAAVLEQRQRRDAADRQTRGQVFRGFRVHLQQAHVRLEPARGLRIGGCHHAAGFIPIKKHNISVRSRRSKGNASRGNITYNFLYNISPFAARWWIT